MERKHDHWRAARVRAVEALESRRTPGVDLEEIRTALGHPSADAMMRHCTAARVSVQRRP